MFVANLVATLWVLINTKILPHLASKGVVNLPAHFRNVIFSTRLTKFHKRSVICTGVDPTKP